MNMHSPDSAFEPIDARRLRDVLGCFATGVAVVTTTDGDGEPIGLTINSFASVSLDPPQVLWSIGLEAPSRSVFQTSENFAINIMPADRKDLTLQFARPSDDKFQGVDWRPGWGGVPVLCDALAALECRTKKRITSGDHEIYIGGVQAVEVRGGDPLIFHRGQFLELGARL